MAILFLNGSTTFADVVNSFSIDESNQPNITSTMLTKNRENAVSHVNELMHNKNDPSVGNATATVVLVEFMDFKCPLSEKMDPLIQALVAKHANFHVIYKIVPIHGNISIYAAKAALAANLQGKYGEYHKALMRAGSALTQEKVITIAKARGINMDKLKVDMDSPAIKKQLEDNMKLFHAIGLLGTPVLFFMKSSLTDKASSEDVVVLMGAFTQSEIENVIDDVNSS